VDERISLDDWEVGELSIEYDDQEPEEVIRWALETFASERVAVCTSFQIDGMAILDMAWRINPEARFHRVHRPPAAGELRAHRPGTGALWDAD